MIMKTTDFSFFTLKSFIQENGRNNDLLKYLNNFIIKEFYFELEKILFEENFKNLDKSLNNIKRKEYIKDRLKMLGLDKYWEIEYVYVNIDYPEMETSEIQEIFSNNFDIYISFKVDKKDMNLFDIDKQFLYEIPRVCITYDDYRNKISYKEKNLFIYPYGFDYSGDIIPIVKDISYINILSKRKDLFSLLKYYYLKIKVLISLKIDPRLHYCIIYNLPLHKL